MAVKRGDVVLMVTGELGRPRPGVVVQSDELGERTTSVLICPLSSEVEDTQRLRPMIEPTAGNGLRLRSQIMTEKLLAVRRERIRGILGAIDADTSEQLDRALLVVLGLAR